MDDVESNINIRMGMLTNALNNMRTSRASFAKVFFHYYHFHHYVYRSIVPVQMYVISESVTRSRHNIVCIMKVITVKQSNRLPYVITTYQIDPYSVSSPTLSVPKEVRSVISKCRNGLTTKEGVFRLTLATRVVITSTGGISRLLRVRRESLQAESLLAVGLCSLTRGGFFFLQSIFGRKVHFSSSFSSARLLRSSSSALLVRARFCSRLTPS